MLLLLFFISIDALRIPSPECGVLQTPHHLTLAATAMFQFRRFFLLLFEPGARNPIIIGHGKPPVSKIFDTLPIPNSLTPHIGYWVDSRRTSPCHQRRWQRFSSSPRQAKNEGQIAGDGANFFQLPQGRMDFSSGSPGLPNYSFGLTKCEWHSKSGYLSLGASMFLMNMPSLFFVIVKILSPATIRSASGGNSTLHNSSVPRQALTASFMDGSICL